VNWLNRAVVGTLTIAAVALLLALLSGCAMHIGTASITMAEAPDEQGGVESLETTTECKGVTFAFGQSDPCGIEGEAISVPGVSLVHTGFCAGLSYLGRTPPLCEPPE
jgi:hypothetical protein